MRNILQVVERLSDFSPDSDLMKKWQKAQKKKDKKADQPRPSNSWMVMLNVLRKNRSILVPDCLSPALIASWLSTVKENATAHFHDRFTIAANKVKKSHQTFFPDYRYKPYHIPATRSGSKASSARNPRSSSDSASPSTSGSSSRSVKSTRTARKNASSPYPTHHASRTRSPQPQSGPEYHVASLGPWTDPLPLSSRPVGGVFLTNSAYESVVPRDLPTFSQSSKASSARNSGSSSEFASPSPSSHGSSSRSVKSTRTARKNASSPYPTRHTSRTPSPKPQSGPEYHVASLGSWTDSLPLSSRPVGGVFLTNSAYESVARQDSPAFTQSMDHDLEATDGPARDDEPVDGAFEAVVHKSSSSPGPFAQPTPSNHPSPSAPSFEQPFIGASAAVQSPPHVAPPSSQPQAERSPAHIAQTTLPDHASPFWVSHESSTLFGEFEGPFAGYAEPCALSDDSDTPLTPLDIATFVDTRGSSHEPASPSQSSPHIGYPELSLPPGIPVASDLFALYDEPFVPSPSYEEPLIPISGIHDADDLFAGTRFGNAYWRNEVYVGGFEFGGSSAY